ncbi:MAG: Ni/Fe hydrogenase subunit alpha [Bryobacteraceae bacterium]|jgi:NAD-reducing hydrogenase large subunit
MSSRLMIEPVTRIEGHAKISIQLNDAGEVESSRFHITEFRGFEKICEGRPFEEMPGLMSRVCGICPVSHVLASSKAGDMLLGVSIPVAAEKQRRLVNYAQLLQSHALSFFHLSAPDLLLGMDSPPATRNILGLLERDPDFLRRGIRLRQFGQRVIELVGGKRVHPGWSGPGGVHRRFTTVQRDEILTWIPEALASVTAALDRLKPILDSFREEIANMGNFPSLFLATVNPDGGLEYYDGKIRIVDGKGNIFADDLDPARYFDWLGEASEDFTFVKFPFYRPLGYPGGFYRVGPLARLNVARFAGTERADRELREFKERSAGAVCESFHYHLARLVEMLHAVERIEQLMSDADLFGDSTQARASLNRREGIGSCEAPRGTLFHHYQVDANGLMIKANLLIATGQNNHAMNLAVDQAARHFLGRIVPGIRPDEGILNRLEAAIRCFDPCLSCSTHALGQMPLIVEWIAADGSVLGQIARRS